MDLILWRHADAETLVGNQSDNERELTRKGQKQAAKMALWLESVLPHQCKILVSPSQRTIQTAQALARQFDVVNEVGTGSTTDQILSACNWPHSLVPVLVIGHQPLLGQTVSKLIPTIHMAAIGKANVWWISQKDGIGYPTTFLKAVMAPDLVAINSNR